MIKVSVIVPVYNVEKYLRKCLNSLVNQTLQEIEILVVNDGSQDGSQQIIDEFKEKFPSNLQGSTGVLNTLDFVNQKYNGSKKKRHFIDKNDILTSADGIKFLVSTEWGIGNINKFVELARNENFDIQEK